MEKTGITLKIWGDFACFTRPEMKVERVSYDVMTPSAARGILEAILWKPAIRWVVTGIDVLRPVKWISVRRNEVGAVISAASAKKAMNNGSGRLCLYVEDERQQRAGLFLRDVAYRIHARFELTGRAGEGDNAGKFLEMFKRRAAKGQCFNQPYLGCREFSAHFALDDGSDAPCGEVDGDLGWMLYDIDHSSKESTPLFFRARVEEGCLKVPAPDSPEVLS